MTDDEKKAERKRHRAEMQAHAAERAAEPDAQRRAEESAAQRLPISDAEEERQKKIAARVAAWTPEEQRFYAELNERLDRRDKLRESLSPGERREINGLIARAGTPEDQGVAVKLADALAERKRDKANKAANAKPATRGKQNRERRIRDILAPKVRDYWEKARKPLRTVEKVVDHISTQQTIDEVEQMLAQEGLAPLRRSHGGDGTDADAGDYRFSGKRVRTILEEEKLEK